MTRKSPVKHRVRAHNRKGQHINDYARGKGAAALKIANPRFKNISSTNMRIKAKISELKRFKQRAKDENNQRMSTFYDMRIRGLLRLFGKTQKQMRSEILLAGDELSSVRASAGGYSAEYVRDLEGTFKLMQEVTRIKYPEPKYVLAKGLEQDAPIVGYKPKSEKLVWMSPEKFLSLCTPAFYDSGSLKNIRRKMQAGKPIDALFIDVDVYTCQVKSHEGRHRAKVAQEMGIKKVPVVLYAKDGHEWENANKLPDIDLIRRQRR